LAELSLGAGYRVNDKLRVGLAWRALFAKARFATASRQPSSKLLNVETDNMTGSNYLGFRLGAQYDISKDTQIGLTYRSALNVKVSGKYGGVYYSPAALAVDKNHAEVLTTLPQSLNLGIRQALSENWNLLAEYDWINYSVVNQITLNGKLSVMNGGVTLASDAPDLETDWNDQHVVRIAAEYLGCGVPLRFGYLWTNQIVPSNLARATTTPPGMGHSVTLGSSYALGNFSLDGAMEYAIVSGNGDGAAAGSTASDVRDGKYTATTFGLDLGVSYTF
jgi:long-chain fatty acid transport protein